MKRKDYRSGATALTNDQLLAEIEYHLHYLENDRLNRGETSHLTKLAYFKDLARKRGIDIKNLHFAIN